MMIGPDGVTQRNDDRGAHGQVVGEVDIEADEQRHAGEAEPETKQPARLEALVAELRHDQRREQRHDGDEQTGRGTVERLLRVA